MFLALKRFRSESLLLSQKGHFQLHEESKCIWCIFIPQNKEKTNNCRTFRTVKSRWETANVLLIVHSEFVYCLYSSKALVPAEKLFIPVRSAAHAVVSCTVRAADDDGNLGHAGTGDRSNHLGSILGDSSRFILPTHHEACDGDEDDSSVLLPRGSESGCVNIKY